MSDAVKRMGGNPNVINLLCPVDLVINHSVQIDVAKVKDAWKQN
jgi:aconitate hydratase